MRFYLNGEPFEEIPCEALFLMSERLSDVISLYFSSHPEEYEKFLETEGGETLDGTGEVRGARISSAK